MDNPLKAFEVVINGQVFDYRLGKSLDLDEVKLFFEQKDYEVTKLTNAGRHLLGQLKKNDTDYFLKLAPTVGISILTQNEYRWNDEYNKKSTSTRFLVPKNIESGYFQDSLFYEVTTFIKGRPITQSDYPNIIDFSEHIQSLALRLDHYDENAKNMVHGTWFIAKTQRWYEAVPELIRQTYELHELRTISPEQVNNLKDKPRHGDFAPWHFIKLEGGELILIDGEHAIEGGVEYYDICYFIQRVFSVEKNPESAKKIFAMLIKRGYDKNKLKMVLAARAIGGFLDESLTQKPDYTFADKFKSWIESL